jgi:four helix bundle protein
MSENGRIERFEDLIAWQKARLLTRAVYAASREGRFAKDFRLSGQIQSAAVSIMSNIAEGFERRSTNEYHHFLSISKASCAEVRSLLYVAFDEEYINETKFSELMKQAEEVARIVGALRVAIEARTNQNKGIKR